MDNNQIILYYAWLEYIVYLRCGYTQGFARQKSDDYYNELVIRSQGYNAKLNGLLKESNPFNKEKEMGKWENWNKGWADTYNKI